MGRSGESNGSALRKWALLLGTIAGLALGFCLARIWAWDPLRLSQEVLLAVSRTLGCRLEAQKVEVVVFPRPQVIWSGCRLVWKGGARATVQELRALPALPAMAMGRIGLSFLEITGMDLAAEHPGRLLETLSGSSGWPNMSFPDLSIQGARVESRFASGPQVVLSELRGRLVWGVAGGEVFLSFDLQRPDRGTSLKNVVLELSLEATSGSARVRRLSLGEPPARFSGELKGLRDKGQWELRLSGEPMELASIHLLTTRIAPEILPARDLLGRVRAGRIRGITLLVQGEGRDPLPKLHDVWVGGELQGGEVILPGPIGALRGLAGRLRFSEGVLELSSWTGQIDSGRLRNGTFRIKLTDPRGPIHLEAQVDADLHQVHRILEEWLQEGSLRSEIRNLFRVRGRAEGRVVVDGPLASPGLWAEAQQLRLWARHRALPYALEIHGGSLAVGPQGIVFKDLRGTVGSSSYSGLSGSVDPYVEGWMDLRLGPTSLELEEAWIWLGDRLKRWVPFGELSSVQGRLLIREGEVNGPLREPEKWQGHMVARLEAQAQSVLLGGEVRVSDAEVELSRDSLSVKGARVELPGSDFRLDGNLVGWLEEVKEADLSIQGRLGQKALEPLVEPISQATGIRWRLPQELRPNPMRLGWGVDGVSVSGELLWKEGLGIHLDLRQGHGGLRIAELSIQDPPSRAVISLHLGADTSEVSFQGHLLGSTLDLLMEKNPLGRGEIEGNMRARWTGTGVGWPELQGELLAKEIPLVQSLGGSALVLIEGSLMEEEKVLHLDHVRLGWKGKEMLLTAKGQISERGLEAEATMGCQRLELEEAREMMEELTAIAGGKIRGKVGIRLAELGMGALAVRPFHADLELEPGGSQLGVREANLCGVGLSGMVDLEGDPGWGLHLVARGTPLDKLLDCLGLGRGAVEGKMDLQGELRAKGLGPAFWESLEGPVELVIRRGKLGSGRVWEQVLERLQGWRDLQGWVGLVRAQGLMYSEVQIKGRFEKGVLHIQDAHLKGPKTKAVSMGRVDTVTGQMEMEILGAATRVGKKDSRQQGYVLFGLRVSGDLSEPSVARIEPMELSTALLGQIKKLTPEKTGVGAKPTSKSRKSRSGR